jgi:mismatch-specific thymine-DNA glycosylase
MEGSREEDIKPEDTAGNSSTAEPSFKGRLALAEYTFSPKLSIKDESTPSPSPTPSSTRRSLRKGSIAPAELPTTTSSSKRKLSSLTASPSRSSSKKSRSPSGYAPPSKYAHLSELTDIIVPDLICVFIGLNPGITTATAGHAYAHPSNRFWHLLHSSGLTTRKCRPQEDVDLPRLFELGNTNIVARPTRNGAELSKAEMDASVKVLEDKIRRYKPEAVCIVGKSIWESIWRVQHERAIKKDEFKYGWQDEGENMGVITEEDGKWDGAKVFVATSTSGLAATPSFPEKERIWRELGVWVEQRRSERVEAR